MRHPWYDVPLDDYEGHMRDPGVGQLDVLKALFAETVATCQPRSIAILGVAGGNGLDVLADPGGTRVVGVDINPEYLDATRLRFPAIEHLELHCVDLSCEPLAIEPVDLVHAALIFEHAGTATCLETAVSLVKPGGHLSVVLQLPSAAAAAVGTSPFASIQHLAAGFALVDREALCRQLTARHCHVVREATRPLPSGKAFWLGIFAKDGPARGGRRAATPRRRAGRRSGRSSHGA